MSSYPLMHGRASAALTPSARAEAYIRSKAAEGWKLVPTRYDDGGLSGGNLDRPALAALVENIEAGKVNCVVVYKVDRLSRSLTG